MELVFNGMRLMILLISKDGSFLEVYLQLLQSALLEDGYWVEAIAPFLLNSASVLLFPFILLVLIFIDMTIQVSITFFNILLSFLTDLSSQLIPSNTRICFGPYAVVAEAPTAS